METSQGWSPGCASQLCRACVASSCLGSREESAQITLRVSNDLLSLFEAKRVGEVISVVAHEGSCLDSKGKLISVIHAVFVRSTQNSSSPMSVAFARPLFPRYYTWQQVLGWSKMLCDPTISETGSNDYFRLSLLLSCVISQSKSTTSPVHVLAVGVWKNQFSLFVKTF